MKMTRPPGIFPAGLISFFRGLWYTESMKNVYLIGMMGAGKTSIGRIAAEKAHCTFVETDRMIEETAGKTVSEIFETEGEEGFRRRETEMLRSLSKKRNRVVSTGGGIVVKEENIELMRKSGTVIWLKRDLNRVIQNPRIRRRPLLAKDVNVIFRLMEEREPSYKKACHFVVYNDQNRLDAVNEILRIIGRGMFPERRHKNK